MTKYLFAVAGLLMGEAHAQKVNFARGYTPLEKVPGHWQDALAWLQPGDSVKVLRQPRAMAHAPQATTRQYLFVQYDAWQGWVMRSALTNNPDSVARPRRVRVGCPSGDARARQRKNGQRPPTD